MPTLTKDERDRRWGNIRATMEKRGLECLIVYGSSGLFGQLNSNLRYLSNAANEGYLIFPLQDEPTLISFVPHREPEQWITDCRGGHPIYSKAIADRIKELHLDNAKIGIVGLSGYYGERGFSHTTYQSLIDSFPKTKLEDATDIVEQAKIIKSPAEIRCLEHACEVGEKVIQVIKATAKVGVTENEVRAEIISTMLKNGCELITLILFGSGKELLSAAHGGYAGHENSRALEAGDMILSEFDAKYMGYLGQFNQPFSIREPSPEWKQIVNVALDAFNNGLKALKPGITVGALDEAFLSPLKEAGYTYAFPQFHGLGLSIEEPFGSFPFQPTYKVNKSYVIEPNMVLEFEPHVLTPDRKKGLHIGCPVLVTETGCRLLTKHWKPELIII